MSGWRLYFITDLQRTAVKIGLTRRGEDKRLHDLQAGSPVRLVVDHVEHDVAPAVEVALHQHFARHWRHREWFDYADAIKQLVAQLVAGDRSALDAMPPAPYPKGRRTAGGWLLTNEDTLRYIRDGVSIDPATGLLR